MLRPTMSCRADSCNLLDPKEYNHLQSYSVKEDTAALEKVVFLETPREDHVHLDIGCGPGTFTKNYLLPRSLPCQKFLAIDRSPTMVEFARQHSAHKNIVFEVFNFCADDVDSLVAKYGHFNRVYSFIAFHYMKDERKAFKELARLLTPNSGECLITAAVSTAPFDAWLELHLMERWRKTIPDPRLLLSEQFSFHFGKSKAQVESDVRQMVSEAGLKCVSLQVYDTAWRFTNVNTCADAMVEAMGLRKYVSEQDLGELKADMAHIMNGPSMQNESEYCMKSTLYSIHAQSAVV